MNVLEIDQVSQSFRGRGGREVAALRDVSLAVRPGGFQVIRGPSGSGKTTLLLAAGGLLAPRSGRVLVCGEDLYAMNPEQRSRFRARHIGFVFQQFYLIAYLNVLENILAPTLALKNAAAQERARQLASRFGLEHRIDHTPAELSTGERQRVALCRALLNEPALVLADEPTGNLDQANARILIEHLRSYAAEGGAVLLATHDTRVEADSSCELVSGELVSVQSPVVSCQ